MPNRREAQFMRLRDQIEERGARKFLAWSSKEVRPALSCVASTSKVSQIFGHPSLGVGRAGSLGFGRRGDMADHKDVSVIATKEDMFVVVDGVRIARRGYLGTPQDGTWVSLVPGWEVVDNEDLRTIAVKHNGVIVH